LLSVQQQYQAALGCLNQLQRWDRFIQSETIAAYLANDGELDTQPIIDFCWRHKKTVVLPAIHPFNTTHLLFLHYRPNTAMTANRFNIAEPRLDSRAICILPKIDMLLVPTVAFDGYGNRLGMGGGFYDRTLAELDIQLEKQRRTITVGIAHHCQRVDKIPSAIWDKSLDYIVTDKQKIKAQSLNPAD
jgi:5-formyltetrahydrofolate cyclo-ligase